MKHLSEGINKLSFQWKDKNGDGKPPHTGWELRMETQRGQLQRAATDTRQRD
jgi:hypothetical protein